MIQNLFVFFEEFCIFGQARLDVLIVEELREDGELLPEELVGEVDGGVEDAGAVGADGVGHVADADGVQVLVVTRLLHKHLHVEIFRRNLHNYDYIYRVDQKKG